MDMSTPAVIPPYATTAVAVIFALTYLGIALGHIPGLKLNRTGIALLGAIAVVIFSRLPTLAVVDLVNWPTVLLLFGFFVISAQLRLSGFFDRVAGAISGRLGHPGRFLLILMLATAGLSAFLNHDIVCFVFTPVVATALLKRQINPVPFLIALAVASNIGAAATIVGNPQDMMIAEVAHLNFGSYALWCLPPVLFAFGLCLCPHLDPLVPGSFLRHRPARRCLARSHAVQPHPYDQGPGDSPLRDRLLFLVDTQGSHRLDRRGHSPGQSPNTVPRICWRWSIGRSCSCS